MSQQGVLRIPPDVPPGKQVECNAIDRSAWMYGCRVPIFSQFCSKYEQKVRKLFGVYLLVSVVTGLIATIIAQQVFSTPLYVHWGVLAVLYGIPIGGYFIVDLIWSISKIFPDGWVRTMRQYDTALDTVNSKQQELLLQLIEDLSLLFHFDDADSEFVSKWGRVIAPKIAKRAAEVAVDDQGRLNETWFLRFSGAFQFQQGGGLLPNMVEFYSVRGDFLFQCAMRILPHPEQWRGLETPSLMASSYLQGNPIYAALPDSGFEEGVPTSSDEVMKRLAFLGAIIRSSSSFDRQIAGALLEISKDFDSPIIEKQVAFDPVSRIEFAQLVRRTWDYWDEAECIRFFRAVNPDVELFALAFAPVLDFDPESEDALVCFILENAAVSSDVFSKLPISHVVTALQEKYRRSLPA